MAQLVQKEMGVANTVPQSALEALISTKETHDLIEKTLGKSRVQTFIGSALTVVQSSNLQDVEPVSLFNCLLKSATYNFPLDQSLGFAYCVPYKNKEKVKIGQFQLGWKGIVELAYRTNKYKRLNVKEVKDSEIVGIDFFGEEQIKWDTSPDRDKKPTVGYMAAFELTNGMTKRIYWSNAKILEHANRYSKSHQNAIREKNTSDDLWTNNFDAMAKKTVLKSLISQFGPKSVEMQNAFRFDQAQIKRDGNVETAVYVDADFTDKVDENKNYSIDTANEPENTLVAPENTTTQVNGDGGFWIDYKSEYLPNKEKYERCIEEGSGNAYDKSTGKIRVREKMGYRDE